MNLYQVKQEYLRAMDNLEIDEETGEILNLEEIEHIEETMNEKIENTALCIKNLTALKNAVKAEKQALSEREKQLDKKVTALEKMLGGFLTSIGKTKFETEKVKITFRKSVITDIVEGFVTWAQMHAKHLLNFKDPEPNKTAIKEAIKKGEDVRFAQITEKQNMQIK